MKRFILGIFGVLLFLGMTAILFFFKEVEPYWRQKQIIETFQTPKGVYGNFREPEKNTGFFQKIVTLSEVERRELVSLDVHPQNSEESLVLTENDLKQISRLPFLVSVEFDEVIFPEGETVKKFLESRPFETLLFSETNLSDGMIRNLVQMPNLKSLFLHPTNSISSEAAILWIDKCPNLTQLTIAIPHDPMTKDALIQSIGQHLKMESLCLTGGSDFPEIDLNSLKNLTDMNGMTLQNLCLVGGKLEPICSFSKMFFLNLDRIGLKDIDLVPLKKMTSLTHLNLVGNKITDAGLEALKDLTSLGWVTLSEPGVTGVGLVYLNPAHLNSLNLSGTAVTDAELEHLKRWSQMVSLDLSGTAITDEGLKTIASLTSLIWLHLSNTAITDEGLKNLVGLKNLSTLELNDTAVTNAGLDILEVLPKLHSVQTRDTHVTEQRQLRFFTRHRP